MNHALMINRSHRHRPALLRWLPLLVLVGSVAASVLLINVVMTHVVERQMGARHDAARAMPKAARLALAALPEVAQATQVARADPR